ncbi:MAG: DUF3362 domain-containing protein, partial [Kiritimatiellae bacterium]|nr:DUF3362 domain-containing protein [Kiritimatiellia bacterium]
EKQLQRALLQWRKPQNRPMIREAMKYCSEAGRADLLELLGEHDRKTLAALGSISPLPFQAFTEARRVQLGRIVVIGVILIPNKSVDDPVVVFILKLHTRVDDPLGTGLGGLCRIDVGIVSIRKRHIRQKRHALTHNLDTRLTIHDAGPGCRSHYARQCYR